MKSKPLCLCGFMGVGKTTIGKSFSKKTNLKFIDLDEVIEKEGRKITEIFKTEGELKFREMEFNHLKKILTDYDVIALGGGSLLNSKTLKLVLEETLLVYLEKPLKDLPKDLNNRPLLQSKDREELFQQRLPGYQRAHFTLNLLELDQNQIYDKLQALWDKA